MPTQITDQQRELTRNAAIAHARLIGVFIALPFGALAMWLDSYIVERARNGESFYGFGKGYAAMAEFTLIGVALLIGGPRVARFFQSLLTRKKDFAYWVMGLAVILPGFLAYIWLQHRIEAMLAATP